LGGALWTAPGESPVTLSDVSADHYSGYTELRANLNRRAVMADIITAKKVWDSNAFNFVHTAGYKFRLPFLPHATNVEFNSQAFGGGIVLYDGATARRSYGVWFEWSLNPGETSFGEVRCWSKCGTNRAVLVAGQMTPDTSWHEVKLIFDYREQASRIEIDGQHYPSVMNADSIPDGWSEGIFAAVMADVASVYPGSSSTGWMGRVEIKDWYWNWEPYETAVQGPFFPDSVSVAGTFNAWNYSANGLSRTLGCIWQGDLTLTNETAVRFKFVGNGTWNFNWGEMNQTNFYLPLSGVAGRGHFSDIYVSNTLNGVYRFTLNEQTGAYTVQKVVP